MRSRINVTRINERLKKAEQHLNRPDTDVNFKMFATTVDAETIITMSYTLPEH